MVFEKGIAMIVYGVPQRDKPSVVQQQHIKELETVAGIILRMMMMVAVVIVIIRNPNK